MEAVLAGSSRGYKTLSMWGTGTGEHVWLGLTGQNEGGSIDERRGKANY